MRRVLSAIAVGVVVAGLVGPAAGAAGQCTVSGYDTFECDVAMDGGGLTFVLPDGQTFAFALVEEGEGLGYLIAPDAAPGVRPEELGDFSPVAGQAGCWVSARDADFSFCVLVAE